MVVWVRPCAGWVDAVGAEAMGVGPSVVAVEAGPDAAVFVAVPEVFNPSECFPSTSWSEFFDFMFVSS